MFKLSTASVRVDNNDQAKMIILHKIDKVVVVPPYMSPVFRRELGLITQGYRQSIRTMKIQNAQFYQMYWPTPCPISTFANDENWRWKQIIETMHSVLSHTVYLLKF